MTKSVKYKISLAAYFLLSFCVIIGRFLLPRWETHDCLSILSWDVFGYYLYLPAYFIHHDLGIKDFSWLQHILDTYHPTIGFYQAYQGPAGDYIMKYPMGLAILYSPFFFIGHFFATTLRYAPDGFSLPYQMSIAMGGLFYAIIGLWFFRKVLLHFFSDFVSAFIMVLIILGTNYFELTAYDSAMPHNYLFTLLAIILWLTIRWHENPKWKYSIFMGLFIGLSILVRPTDGIFILIPLLWGIFNKESLRIKWKMLKVHSGKVMICILSLILVVFMQMLYWKIHAGSFLYYSYEKGENLRFIAPFLLKVLFSYKKGWLIYAPVMVFAIIGFIFLYRKNRMIFYAAFLFFIVNLLIISSWPTWWFGGSLGQRTFMESYPLMALPLGYFLQWLTTTKLMIKIPVYVAFLFFIILNLFQTWQYMNFILDSSQMTKKYYWTIFARTHVPESDRKYLEPIESNEREYLQNEEKYYKRKITCFDYEKAGNFSEASLSNVYFHSGSSSFKMNKEVQFSPGLTIPFMKLSSKEEEIWIRATGYVYFICKPEEVLANLVVTCRHKRRDYKYRSLVLENEKLKPDVWNKVTIDYLCPYIPDKNDFLQVYFWYRGDKDLFVDDLCIELFKPKKSK